MSINLVQYLEMACKYQITYLFIFIILQTGGFVSDDVSAQADQCLKNLGAVLKAAGGSYSDGKLFGSTYILHVFIFVRVYS